MVLLNDDLKVINTWYGGELAVEDSKVTAVLDEQLSNHRYQYPKKAYQTVNMPAEPKLIPDVPEVATEVTVLRTELPGIVTLHRKANLDGGSTDWGAFVKDNDCCSK